MKKYVFSIFTAAILFTTISCSLSPSNFTVTYETNGFGQTPKAVSVPYGAKLTDAQLPVLTADNKVFGGWFKESKCTTKWDKDVDTVTKDITLYAKWQNAQPLTPLEPSTELFTVTFNVQGVGTAPNSVKIAKGEKLTNSQLPNPTADKKRFDGWYKESACTTKWLTDTDTVTEDTILYAKWTNLFTVTFNTNGVEMQLAPVTVEAGAKLTAAQLPNPTADKKRFDGWYKEQSCSTKWLTDTDTVTQDTILYAKWTNLFTVTFNTNGVGTQLAPVTVEAGAKLTAAQLPNPTADKKRFDGWYKEQSCSTKWLTDTDTVTQDTTLYTKWTNLFTVTFNTNGVEMQLAPVTVESGAKLTAAQLPNPTADKKRFDGWYKEQSCSTKWLTDTDTVTQDTTLYAKWTNLFTVKFNTRGLVTAPADIEVANDEIIPPSLMPTNPSHLTWEFAGWHKDKKNSQAWNNSDKVTGDITLYAKWNPKTVAPTDLWKSKTDRPNDYYRIPALAETKSGSLLAVADLRYNHAADVGRYNSWGSPSDSGEIHRIDLVMKESDNNGIGWSSPDRKLTNAPEPPEYGCGDAAIVADRDSNEVLIIHVQGNVRYQKGKQSVMALKSTDGGKTFTSADITDKIYGMNSAWQRMFVTSGKIHQSRFIKVDKYYRIYAAPLIGDFGNTVIYSDDFGDTWKVLGGNANEKPVPTGDEAKVEELPDGRVIISSRCGKGRYINIFTYTNKNTGEGNWQSSNKWLNLGNDSGSGTNGEVLIIKARTAVDKTPVYLALQSIPKTSGRNDVTIYWRTITADVSLDEFTKGSEWQQYQIHTGTSAYSTMIQQKDGRIGFLYEYNAQGSPAGFDIKYKSLTIQKITGNQYEAAFLTE